MAADDLVEALPRQRSAAEVDEQLRARCARRPGAAGHGRGSSDRGRAPPRPSGPGAPSSPCPAPAATPGQVDVGELEVHRLRRAQPARVHQLEDRPVAQLDRLGPARPPSSRLTSERPSTMGSFCCAAARRSRRRVRVEHPLPAQVAVEGAQAGRLSLDARGRERHAGIAARERGQEVGDIGGVAPRRPPVLARRGTRRTGAGRSGTTTACSAKAPARAPDRRGSRARGPRIWAACGTAAVGWRRSSCHAVVRPPPPLPCAATGRPAQLRATRSRKEQRDDQLLASRQEPITSSISAIGSDTTLIRSPSSARRRSSRDRSRGRRAPPRS